MSIENEIAGLTQSTTDLLEAVNTKKATLDTAVSNAQTAVTDATSQVSLAAAEKVGAQTARDTAETFKDQAYTYSQSAASAVAYQDLTAIAQTKAESAVDVFVYDTSKDSDGGAWRKRTQHTSWYNETLNTATRGSRKEFPAVAVIVLSGSGTGSSNENKVTIYDGDDPSLPMWMQVAQVSQIADMLGRRGVSSTAMKDGLLLVTTNDSALPGGFTPLIRINFISDVVKHTNTVGTYTFPNVIAERADAPYSMASTTDPAYWKPAEGAIVNQTQNDVAMTVLPDAPIDPATGLPIPTIAVATDGGVSVIKDDGTVVDWLTSHGVMSDIYIDGELLVASGGLGLAFYSWGRYSLPLSDTDDFDFISSTTFLANKILRQGSQGNSRFEFPTKVKNGLAYGEKAGSSTNDKLFLLDSVKGDVSLNNTAHITSTYNTGWMNGDIKLATLSDTDDTDLVGSELVTNGTFDTDTTGWTAVNGAALSVVSGTLKVEDTTGSFGYARQTFATEIGKTYTVSLDIVDASNSTINFAQVGSSVDADLYTNSSVGVVSNSSWSFTFTAQTTTSAVQVTGGLGIGKYTTYDNISVRLAEPDRSVNNNGLQVFGTVQKNPVATGADLVAYSGFSATNYLEQPYNSDLDFGTGDFCVMGWVKTADTGSGNKNIMRWQGDTGLGAWRFRSKEGKLALWVSDDGVNTIREVVGSSDIDNNNWAFVSVVRSGDLLTAYVNGTLENTSSLPSGMDLSSSDAVLYVGVNQNGSEPWIGSLALLRISATTPTAEQIAKIYRDEKVLFQENAKATLHGTSDAVTALAYDDTTELLHVGTSAGRSVFKGLQRVDNTTDAVDTAISASNNLVVEE